MKKLLNHIGEAIGQTPMVRLDRLVKAYGVAGNLCAKLEYLNPGHSKKDRIALQMIEEAEQRGALVKGQEVVELTSGNTGTGLAIVCGVKGYKFVAVMSKGNSPERARMMRALGAEVVLVDQAEGAVVGQVSGDDLALVEEAADRIVRERKAFRAGQFQSEANVNAHIITGNEMWEQCDGDIDVFLDFAGTLGTFVGCSIALKQHNSAIRCYVVEPEGAPYLAGQAITNPNHQIQGGGYNMQLPLLREGLVTGYLTVSDEEAIEAARNLAKYEGIFAGFSSGANVAAAIQLLRGTEEGKSIAITVNDTGLKYLSTELY
ncbi:MAG: cysteine synthase family protein [Oscillospiraceae bacterium]|nr:cysteine synthase family protein [Oscillospiraceae bacterium]